MQKITGIVDRIRFYNVHSGYVILKLIVDEEEPMVVVGETTVRLYPGQMITSEGYYTEHPEFGQQFVAKIPIEAHLPKTEEGLKKLLGSGFIKGIGKAWAMKLVDHFGLDVIHLIRTAPEKLSAMPGVTPKRQAQWTEAIEKNFSFIEASAYLASLGLGPMRAQTLLQKYGVAVVDIVREKPYQLYQENRGFGFRIVDSLAMNNGIPADSMQRLQAGITYVLEEASAMGHCYMPEEMICEKLTDLLGYTVERAMLVAAAAEMASVRLQGGRVALTVVLEAEHTVARHLCRIMRNKVADAQMQRHKEAVASLLSGDNILSEEQIQAIHMAISERCVVITGGPGVGKTTVIRAILRTFEISGFKVLLAAPTGRAAKRLKESTSRAASTIHRLLKFDPSNGSFVYSQAVKLPADVVILDEVSMLDITLMAHVVAAIADGCSFIMVGDRDQLPSVGPGSVLADIIQSGLVPVVSLTHIFRQARFSKIIQTAHRIRHGEMPAHHPDSDCIWLQCTDTLTMLEQLKALYTSGMIEGWDAIKDIQVLTAMHKGHVGTKQLNLLLKAQLNPSSSPYAVGDKVIQLRNNYDKEVFNGDMGIIQRLTEEGLAVLMDDGRTVQYATDELSDLLLAYATTVHKSQGSEYPVVVVMLATEHFMLLNRHLLYTAVTRARKRLIIIAPVKAVAMAIKNEDPGLRRTQLAEIFSEVSLAQQV